MQHSFGMSGTGSGKDGIVDRKDTTLGTRYNSTER